MIKKIKNLTKILQLKTTNIIIDKAIVQKDKTTAIRIILNIYL